MAIKSELWRESFIKLPEWPCPTCRGGTLRVIEDTLKAVETGPSEKEHDHAAWDPDWIQERFAALLRCQGCGELVAAGGTTSNMEYYDDENQERELIQSLYPLFLHPAPPIFPIPKECPEQVADELAKAFSLFWIDGGSCANRLRTATEILLNDRRVQKSEGKQGRRKLLTLHRRIELFQAKNKKAADFLLAIKWLGNAGSHAALDRLEREDLLTAFELFEHVVEVLYVKHEERLRRAAKAINDRKGIPRKKRSVPVWA